MSRTIVYSSPFVPPEWIAAHGLRPLRLIPDRLAAAAPQGVCPFAGAFACAAGKPGVADGIVMATTCDQMRRMAEQLSRTSTVPVFTLNVPATWQTISAQRMYVEELQRLGRFLVSLGGKSPDPSGLAEQIRLHDAERTALLERAASRPGRSSIPVALVGGPLRLADRIVYDLIERAGGYIALDATETGQRTFPPPVNPRHLDEDPLMELADVYFRIPDVFRRPNTLLYQYLRHELAERGIRGIFLVRCVWCDLWHAELVRLKQWAQIPVVELDLGEEGDWQRCRTRIESLLESLR